MQGSIRYEGEFKDGEKHGKVTCYHSETSAENQAASIFNEIYSEGTLIEGSQEDITNEPHFAYYKNGRPNKASVDNWMERKVKQELAGTSGSQLEETKTPDTPDPNAYSWYNPVGWLAGASSTEVPESDPAQPQTPVEPVSEAKNEPTEAQ